MIERILKVNCVSIVAQAKKNFVAVPDPIARQLQGKTQSSIKCLKTN